MSRECTKMKARLIRLGMCFAVALGILWGTSNPAFAAAGDLVIAGTSNDSTKDCSGQGWSYVASTHTLTLDGFQFSYKGTDTDRPNAAVSYAGTDALTIALAGKNNIVGCWSGITSDAALTISGSGSLSIEGQSDDENHYTDGIRVNGYDLTIKNAAITVNTDGFAIHGKGVVVESGELSATAAYDGIDSQSFTINGGNVKAVGKRCNGMQIVGEGAFVKINGGNVIAEGQSGGSGDMSSGIYCYDLEKSEKGEVSIAEGSTLIACAGTNVAEQLEYVAVYGVVKNAIAGKGWTNYKGEGEGTDIAVNATGAVLTYKKVAFPANAGTQVPADVVTDPKSSSDTPHEKVANTMTVKAGTPAIKAAKVKKKNQKIAAKKAYTIESAVGAVSYKLTGVKKAKFKKYFSVNAKNGAITVKKGLKKGTYKVTVAVTAAGNDTTAQATKKVTVNVKVK